MCQVCRRLDALIHPPRRCSCLDAAVWRCRNDDPSRTLACENDRRCCECPCRDPPRYPSVMSCHLSACEGRGSTTAATDFAIVVDVSCRRIFMKILSGGDERYCNARTYFRTYIIYELLIYSITNMLKIANKLLICSYYFKFV